MTKIKVDTYEELVKYDGYKCFCIIRGTVIDDCLISLQNEKLYLLNNIEDGYHEIDYKDYSCAYTITKGREIISFDIEVLLDSKETEDKPLYQLEPSKCRKVLVRDSEASEWQERYLLYTTKDNKAICVDNGGVEDFLNNMRFSTASWKYYKEIPKKVEPTYIPFDSKEELIEIADYWFRFKNDTNKVMSIRDMEVGSLRLYFSNDMLDCEQLLTNMEMCEDLKTDEWIPVGKIKERVNDI